MSLLEQDTIKKRQVNESLKLEPKLNVRDDIDYEVEVIKDIAVYATEAISQLPRLYFLVS